MLDVASETVRGIRRAKTQRQLSMRAAVLGIVVTGPADLLPAVEAAAADLRLAGAAAELSTAPGGEELLVDVEFDPNAGLTAATVLGQPVRSGDDKLDQQRAVVRTG